MTPTEARTLATGLIAAADKADAEGRDHLTEGDLDVFATQANAAHGELLAAIDRASATKTADN